MNTIRILILMGILSLLIIVMISVVKSNSPKVKENIKFPPTKKGVGEKKGVQSSQKHFYNTGFIDEPRHKNANQCYKKQDIKLSSYYNKPTEMRPVPAMSPNYSLERTPSDCPCAQYVSQP